MDNLYLIDFYSRGLENERMTHDVASLIGRGLFHPETFAAHSEPQDLFELVRKEDIDALMAVLPATRLHYVATDGYTLHMREVVEAMNDAQFALFLKYHYATCEREDMVGLTHHALDIFKKAKEIPKKIASIEQLYGTLPTTVN